MFHTFLFHHIFVLGILNWVLWLFNVKIIMFALSSLPLQRLPHSSSFQTISLVHSLFFFYHRIYSILFSLRVGVCNSSFSYCHSCLWLTGVCVCMRYVSTCKWKKDTKTLIRCTVFDQEIWIASNVTLTRFHIILN